MIKLVDSYSDGMYGYVEMIDTDRPNLKKERVTWSVTSEIDSQEKAMDLARHHLTERALIADKFIDLYR